MQRRAIGLGTRLTMSTLPVVDVILSVNVGTAGLGEDMRRALTTSASWRRGAGLGRRCTRRSGPPVPCHAVTPPPRGVNMQRMMNGFGEHAKRKANIGAR